MRRPSALQKLTTMLRGSRLDERLLEARDAWVILACALTCLVLLALVYVPNSTGGIDLVRLGLEAISDSVTGWLIFGGSALVGTVCGLIILALAGQFENFQSTAQAQNSEDTNRLGDNAVDLDRHERTLARIEPVAIVTSTTIVLLIVLAAVSPLRSEPYGAQIWIFGILGGVLCLYALTRMDRIGSAVVSLLPLLSLLSWSVYFALNTRANLSIGSRSSILMVLLGPPTLLFSYTFWRGWITMSCLRGSERDLLKLSHGTWGVLFLRQLGVPIVLAFVKKRRLVAIVLSLIAASLIGLGSQSLLNHFSLTGFLEEARSAAEKCRQAYGQLSEDQLTACAFQIINESGFLFWAMGAVWLGFVVAGNSVLRMVRELVRPSANELLSTDTRPPILFLRSFRDDQVTLHPSPWTTLLSRLLKLALPRQPLDHLLLEEGTPVGPVVALGSPHDALPPYGIARGYFDHGSWQQAVQDIARDSQAIVLCLDDTEGVWWELAHIREFDYITKTLFMFHPGAADPNEHARISARLLNELRMSDGPQLAIADALEDQLTDGLLGFYRGGDGVLRVATTSTFSSSAYLLLVRSFLHERMAALAVGAGHQDHAC